MIGCCRKKERKEERKKGRKKEKKEERKKGRIYYMIRVTSKKDLLLHDYLFEI